MFKEQDKVYVIVNNMKVEEATIIRNAGDGLFTIQLRSGAGFQVKQHRLFESYEEAEKNLPERFRKKRITSYGLM